MYMDKWVTNPEDVVKGHLYWGNIEDKQDKYELVFCIRDERGSFKVFKSPQDFIGGNYLSMFSDARILLKDITEELPSEVPYLLMRRV